MKERSVSALLFFARQDSNQGFRVSFAVSLFLLTKINPFFSLPRKEFLTFAALKAKNQYMDEGPYHRKFSVLTSL